MRLPSPSKAVKDLVESNFFAFSSNDLRKIYGISSIYAYRLIKRMLRDNIIIKLWRGFYIIDKRLVKGVPVEAYIDSMFRGNQYYFGLRYAASYWRLSDMIPYTIHVLTTKKEFSGRSIVIFGEKFRFIYVSKDKFFGYTRIPHQVSQINISTSEKTFVDSLLFLGRYVSFEDICKMITLGKRKVKWEKVVEYAIKTRKKSLIQRAGYLLDLFNIDVDLKELIKRIGKNPILLDPKRHKNNAEYSKKWRIIVNNKC